MADRRSSPRRRDSRRSEYVDPRASTYVEPRAGDYQNSAMRPTSYDPEPPQTTRGREQEVYSSSSSSSYVDISRTYPTRGSRIRAFFFAPSERRKKVRKRRRSRRGLFRFGNNSSSSIVNEDLAYGTGFIKVHRRRSVRGRNGKERSDGGRYSDREGKDGRRRSGTNLSRTNLSDGGKYSDREGGRVNRSRTSLNEGGKYSDREGARGSRTSNHQNDGGKYSDRESIRMSRNSIHKNDGGRYSDREGGRVSRSKTNLTSAATDAEILALGAGLAKLAREQNKADLRASRSGNARGPELVAVRENKRTSETSRGLGPSRVSHVSNDDDGWESASDSESEASVDLRLAYGNDNKSTWNFFGRKKYKPLSRKDSVVDPNLFGPQNSLHGIIAKPVGFGDVSPWTSTSDFGQRPGFDHPVTATPVPPTPAPEQSFTGSQTSLKHVFPTSTNDPKKFDAGRGSIVSEQRYDPSRNSMPSESIVSEPRYDTSRNSMPPRPEPGRGSMVSESRYDQSRNSMPPVSELRYDPSRNSMPPRSMVSESRYGTSRNSMPPVSESRNDTSRNSMPPGPEPLVSSRPGPIPLQQPQPIPLVSQRVYEPVYKTQRSEAVDSASKQTPPSSGRTKSLAEAALAGVAVTTIGTAIASNRDERKDRQREQAREEEERLRRREAEKKDLEDRRRAEELAELEKERLRREKKDSKDDRKDERRDKDRKKDDDGDGRREKKHKKRRDETREEKEARREKRRLERSDRSDVSRSDVRTDISRSDSRPDSRRVTSEAAVSEVTVDPFQYQVRDDEFSTPTADDPLGHRSQKSVPTVVTVERDPPWMRNSSTKDRPSSSSYEPPSGGYSNYYDQDYGKDVHGDRALREGEAAYDDIRKSTAPYDVAVIGAADAVILAEDARKSRSKQRREERRINDQGYEDYDSRDEQPRKERDTVQEQADRAYREIVMARKIASQVIRSRSASPDRSVLEKYDGKDQDGNEIVRIVTPPGMESHKQKGLYDAPNADFRLDYVLEHPKELHTFNIPAIDLENSSPDTPTKKDPDADRPRPFLNLVRPTPVPSPTPEKQRSRSRSGSRSRDEPRIERRQSVDDVVIGPKGDVVSSPTASSISKGVTWGENETKHYEIVTPSEQKDEFVTKSDVKPRDAPSETKTKPTELPKSRAWGAIAAGIIGAGGAASATNSSGTSNSSKTRENENPVEGPYEYRGVVVEPEEESPKPQRRRSPPTTRPDEEPASPPLKPRRDSPPLTGPKPTTSQSSHMPGSFDDDLDFTAHVAAGLQDTGFDPNIVIDDPSFRRRDSPPGSQGPKFYHAPYAETVTDLGSTVADVPTTQPHGFVMGEVASTPRDWQTVSPARESEETPTKLSKKEQKKRDKEKGRSEDAALIESSSTPRDIVEEPESYFEPKLSKKEQRQRERASKATNIVEDVTTPAIAEDIVEEPESYFVETPKKSKKKSKRSSTVDDVVEESSRESRSVSVPVDAFDDIQNGGDEWTDTNKSKKLKRDSGRYDSPSRSVPPSEVGTELERSSSKKSKDKTKRRSEQYETTPSEISLPPSNPSEFSRDGDYEDSRKSRKSSTKDSGIFSSADRDESRSVVSAGASRYDDDTPKRKKKSRSSGRDDYDDTRSIASAPAGDDYDDKKSKKKDKEKRSSGLWGLFGSKSESGAIDESPKRSKDDSGDKKKSKKSKRSSVPDSSSVYGDIGAASVNDLSRSVSNGHGTKHQYEDYEDGTRSDGEPSEKKRKSRSRSQSVSSKKDSFLDNAGTLGAGVGIASLTDAAIIAQQHSQSKAATADSSNVLQQTSERELSRPYVFDYEVTERQFRPSIDPQYGDLLPLPPSDPSTPESESLDELPELPGSRPETPESERMTREKSISAVRKSLQDTPMKSPSQSTVPLALRFASANRSIPSSPAPFRSSPMQSPATTNLDSLSLARSRSRPTSWDGQGKEYRPLFLVESNRRNSTQLDEKIEDLPALPESSRTSRSSSQIDLDRADDWERDVKSTVPDPLLVDTALASAASPELLGSEQSTPRAVEMPSNIDSVAQSRDFVKTESPIEEPESHALRDIALAAIAGAAGTTVFNYMVRDRTPETTEDNSDELPSIPRQPSPVDPVTKDRSSYLLKSSPLSKNSDDVEDRGRDFESPTKKGKDILQSIEEREGSDMFAIPDDIRAAREKALETLSGVSSPEASKTRDIFEHKEPAEESVLKKSKKDKKKEKKAKKGKSPPAWEIETEDSDDKAQTELETVPDVPTWVAIQQAEESIHKPGQDLGETSSPFDSEPADESSSSKSKKDKKKNKKKGKLAASWEGEEKIASPAVIGEPSEEAFRDLSEDVVAEKEAQPDEEYSFLKLKKDKKGKKKEKSIDSWEDEGEVTSSSVPTEEAADDTSKEIFDEPGINVAAADDEFSLPKSKKDKKKGKKSRSSSYYEPEETVNPTRLVARELTDDQPTPSEATSEDFLVTKLKKDKKKKRKSVTFSEPGDDDQFSDVPKEPWFESGREFINEPVSILKEPSWVDRDSEPEANEEVYDKPLESSSPEEPAVEVSQDSDDEPIPGHTNIPVEEPVMGKEIVEPASPPATDETASVSDSKIHEVDPITVAHVNTLPDNHETVESDKATITPNNELETIVEPIAENHLSPGQEREEAAKQTIEVHEKDNAPFVRLPEPSEDEKAIITVEEPQTAMQENNSRDIETVREQAPVVEQSTADEFAMIPGKKGKKKKKGKSVLASEPESSSSLPEPLAKEIGQESQAEASQSATNDELVVTPSKKVKKKKKGKSFSAWDPEEDNSSAKQKLQISEEPVNLSSEKYEEARKEAQTLTLEDVSPEIQEVSTDDSASRDLSTPSTSADIHEKIEEAMNEEIPIQDIKESDKPEHLEESIVPINEAKVIEPENTVPQHEAPSEKTQLADKHEQSTSTTAEESESKGDEKKGFLARTLFPVAAVGASLFGFGSSKKDEPKEPEPTEAEEPKCIDTEEPKSVEAEEPVAIKAESKLIEARKSNLAKGEEPSLIETEEPKSIDDDQSAQLLDDTESKIPIDEPTTGEQGGVIEPPIPQIEEPPTSLEETPPTLPDGLTAGYKDDQLNIARQLQEEFNRKPSKKGKKKQQSLPSTPDREPSRSREIDDIKEEHPRARSLSIEPSAARSAVSPGSGDRKSVYSEEQLELARQLKQEFGSGSKKSSKKDKKNRSSRSSTRDASPFGEHVESPQMISTEIPEEAPNGSPQTELTRDGFEAGYQEDQLALARQLQAEFGKKSSKKDKKRRSTSQTPQEQEPRNDYFGEAFQPITSEPLPIEESSILPEPAPEPVNTRDGLAVGYSEDQLELARQLKEEFGSGSKKGKKDKKDKKRQSLLRSATDDGFSSDPYSRDADESNVQTPQTEAAESTWEVPPTAEAEDNFATAPKKPKKDKKAKKRESLLQSNNEEEFSSHLLPVNLEITENLETSNEPTADLEADFAPITKKSKKDKKGKKRESILQSNNEDNFSSETLPKDDLDITENFEAGNEPTAGPEDDFAPITKKAKKDKKGKKRESVLKESADDDFSSDTGAREIEAIESVPVETPKEIEAENVEKSAAPEEEFGLPSKKSKKDKKKRQSLLAPEDTLVQSELDESSALDATIPSAAPDALGQELDESQFSSKKSKKEKKKRQSLAQSSVLEESSEPQTESKGMVPESTDRDLEPEKENVLENSQAEERHNDFDTPADKLTSATNIVPSFSTEPTLVQDRITESELQPPIVETEPILPESAIRELEVVPSTSTTEPTVEAKEDNPEEQFSEFAFTKKSKKDKKKRKNASRANSEGASENSSSLDPVSESKDIVEAPEIPTSSSAELPVETISESKDIVEAPEVPTASFSELPVETEPEQTEPQAEAEIKDDEWALLGKKSKKDKKKKRDSLKTSSAGPSGTSTPPEIVPEPLKDTSSSVIPSEETTSEQPLESTLELEFNPPIISVPTEVSEAPVGDWDPIPKMDKKKKRDSLKTSSTRPSGTSTPLEPTKEPEKIPAEFPLPSEEASESTELVEPAREAPKEVAEESRDLVPEEHTEVGHKALEEPTQDSHSLALSEPTAPVEKAPQEHAEEIHDVAPTNLGVSVQEQVQAPSQDTLLAGEEYMISAHRSPEEAAQDQRISTTKEPKTLSQEPLEESIQEPHNSAPQKVVEPVEEPVEESAEESRDLASEESVHPAQEPIEELVQEPHHLAPLVTVGAGAAAIAAAVVENASKPSQETNTEPESDWAVPSKKSKKEKRKKKSGLSTSAEDDFPTTSESLVESFDQPQEQEQELAESTTNFTTEEPVEEWSPPGKKSKKDKKKQKSGLSTPAEDNLPTTSLEPVESFHQAQEPEKDLADTATQEVTEEPTEELSRPGKKSKKDKKRQKSGASTPANEPIASTGETTLEPAEQTRELDPDEQPTSGKEAVENILQELVDEGALPSKKSKQDKKKQKSGLYTPAEEVLPQEIEQPLQGEPKSIENSDMADQEPLSLHQTEAEAPPLDIEQTPFEEAKALEETTPFESTPAELVQEASDDWALPVKKSKKDRKKKSGASTPAEVLPISESEQPIIDSTPRKESAQDDDPSLQEEPDTKVEEWALPGKKSKKDKKKRKSGLSTPTEELPVAETEQADLAFELPTEQPLEKDIVEIEPVVTDEQVEPQDGDWAVPDKKSKKDKKKRKSGMSTPVEEIPSAEPAEQAPEQIFERDTDPTITEEPVEAQDNELSLPSKKSKKNKIKRKSVVSTPIDEVPAFEPEETPEQPLEKDVQETDPLIAEERVEAEEDGFPLLSKKSKKDKKKNRKSGVSTPVEEAPSTEPEQAPAQHPEQPSEQPLERNVDPVILNEPVEEPVGELVEEPVKEPVEEFSLSSKKSKRDKNKNRKSSASTPVEEVPSIEPEQAPEQPFEQPFEQPSEQPFEQPFEQPSEQPFEQPSKQPSEQPLERNVDPIILDEAVEEQFEKFSLPSKKSKKDKKKNRKSGISTPVEETPILESEQTDVVAEEPLSRDIEEAGPVSASPALEQRVDEWAVPGKKSKKDKKRKSSISTPVEDTSVFEPEKIEQSLSKDIEEEVPVSASPTAEPQDDEWALPGKKSKKDKKRISGLSTPVEETPGFEPEQTEQPLSKDNEEEAPVSTISTFEPRDDEWAFAGKKSKKDKKRKSGLSTPVEETPALQLEQNAAVPEQSLSRDIQELVPISTDEPFNQAAEEWALPGKKSKKDKKRKSGFSTPVEETPTPTLDPTHTTLIPEESLSRDIEEPASTIPIDEPIEQKEEEWAISGKKSKKDKKKRKSGLSTPAEGIIVPEAEQLSVEPTNLPSVTAINTEQQVADENIQPEPVIHEPIAQEESNMDEYRLSQEPEDAIEVLSSEQVEQPIYEAVEESSKQPEDTSVSKQFMNEPVSEPIQRLELRGVVEEPASEQVERFESKEVVEEPVSEPAEWLKSREVVEEPTNHAADESNSREIVGEPSTQTVEMPLSQENVEALLEQPVEEWGSFPTKKSKKDKKKRKSGVLTLIEDNIASQPEIVATENEPSFEPSTSTKFDGSVVDHVASEELQQAPTTEATPQETTGEASKDHVDDYLVDQSREIIEPSVAQQEEPAEELFGIVRKKSKKDKKGKKGASRIGSESGPSTSAPTRVPTPQDKIAEVPIEVSPTSETERLVASPIPFEEQLIDPQESAQNAEILPATPPAVFDRDLNSHNEAQDVPGGLSRKSSKKEKRKRQATIDAKMTESPNSSTAPLKTWADDVEEAEVVREVPVIDDIAKDDSLSHIASATPAATTDDFIRPTKKGKKGSKKKTSVDPNFASDSFLEPASDSFQGTSEEERSIVPGLVTAGAVAAASTTVLNKVVESSEEFSSTPVRKLSKKEKRKQSIDKRSPTKADIFDDPALWEGEKPRAHEEENGLEDDAGNDGFWSPPQEEEVPFIHESVEETRPRTPLPEIEREASSSHSIPVIDESRDLPIKDDAGPSHSIAVVETSRDLHIDRDFPTELEPKESFVISHPPTTPIPSRTTDLSHNKDIAFEDTPPILQRHISPPPHGFSGPHSIDRSISPQDRRAEHSKSPFRSSRFSQIGFSDLPVVDEEENPEAEHHSAPPPHLHEDVNRDSAFVSGSPIPHQRAFTDNHEHVRDSGVHLRDVSPATRTHGPVSSSDAAIARLSWPPVDKEHETIDLRRSQRPEHDVTPSSIRHEKRELQETYDSPTLSRRDQSPNFNRGRKSSSSKPNFEEATTNQDLLPSQRSHEENQTDLHRTPTIHGKPREGGIVKQRLQQFQSPEEPPVKQRVERTRSPDKSRSQKPKEDKYAELTSSRPKAEKPKGISDLEAGAAIAGASLGFQAARKLSTEQRPPSVQSQRSLSNINRLRTPDIKRPESSASNRSATPPLRRTDRQRSGDLRSLSQQSKPDLAKEAELAAAASTPSIPNTANPQANEGRVRAKDMADVYDGFGEGRIGSPRSPTRPHSMRRRQSMQVLDLESKVEQLVAENRRLAEEKAQAEQAAHLGTHASSSLVEKDAEIDSLKRTLDWLHNEVSRLTEVNEGLTSANATIARQHSDRYGALETQHTQATRELQEARDAHTNLSAGMEGIVRNEVQKAVAERDREIAELRAELDVTKEKIREMQRQILLSKANDTEFLTVRDEDYFDNACQRLCQHVQQWVLRFSKFSDMRACRLTSEINNDKTIDRLDNAVLDGSDVDIYLSDRVKRRDIFMSMTMTMVWEFIFTRYLFGMDREQRQKLKSLEKTLSEVGPVSAVHTWRAITLTLLAKRSAFAQQRDQDTQAVVNAIIETLSEILPPPSNLEGQIEEQLTRVMKSAVDLSIEMRTQRAEYMMLPPLQPEYDANGDLASKVTFNAALMNERSGDTISNEDLEAQKAVVRIVLFPLVVKKGDDSGEGEEEIVVCPAQVLVAKPKKVRMAEQDNRSKVSMQSSFPMGDEDSMI